MLQLGDQLGVARLDLGERRSRLVDPLAYDGLVGIDVVELVGRRAQGVAEADFGATKLAQGVLLVTDPLPQRLLLSHRVGQFVGPHGRPARGEGSQEDREP